MQDFQPIPGLSGRIFGGSDVRRLRNYPSASLSSAQNQQPPPPTKCPRCESTNTKFCYYNNYNLSQPRHFCKSCRRYWTKGGVLRNVPVGGGCRKNSKRGASSKSKTDKKSISKPDTAPSGSSSESSSTLTAAAPNPNPDTIPEPPPPPILPESSDSFTGLMAGPDGLGFNFAGPSLLPGFRVEDPEKEAAAVDPTAGGLHVMDWMAGGGSADSGSLFDITSSVDPAAYWNQNHWGDADPSLYLP